MDTIWLTDMQTKSQSNDFCLYFCPLSCNCTVIDCLSLSLFLYSRVVHLCISHRMQQCVSRFACHSEFVFTEHINSSHFITYSVLLKCLYHLSQSLHHRSHVALAFVVTTVIADSTSDASCFGTTK